MRCLLNIWGTMLFLRLTWVMGQAGIWQGLLLMTLCNIVTLLSAISMSAVATNGQIAGEKQSIIILSNLQGFFSHH
jgi:solute carrier family 12 sodium/potassium/chloride transporter 2